MQIIHKRNTIESLKSPLEHGITNYADWMEDYYSLPQSRQKTFDIFNNSGQNVLNTQNIHTTSSATALVDDPHNEGQKDRTVYYNLENKAPYSGIVHIFHSIAKHVHWWHKRDMGGSMALRTSNYTHGVSIAAYVNYTRRTGLYYIDNEAPRDLNSMIDESWFFVSVGDRIVTQCSYYHVPESLGEDPWNGFDPYFSLLDTEKDGVDKLEVTDARLVTMISMYHIE